MKVALIDDPTNCFACPFQERGYCNYSSKWLREYDGDSRYHKEVMEWCELRDMPERIEYKSDPRSPIVNAERVTAWRKGFNDCLDKIWGENDA